MPPPSIYLVFLVFLVFPRLVQVVWVTEAVGVSNELDDGRKGMSLEDVM